MVEREKRGKVGKEVEKRNRGEGREKGKEKEGKKTKT